MEIVNLVIGSDRSLEDADSKVKVIRRVLHPVRGEIRPAHEREIGRRAAEGEFVPAVIGRGPSKIVGTSNLTLEVVDQRRLVPGPGGLVVTAVLVQLWNRKRICATARFHRVGDRVTVAPREPQPGGTQRGEAEPSPQEISPVRPAAGTRVIIV